VRIGGGFSRGLEGISADRAVSSSPTDADTGSGGDVSALASKVGSAVGGEYSANAQLVCNGLAPACSVVEAKAAPINKRPSEDGRVICPGVAATTTASGSGSKVRTAVLNLARIAEFSVT
jgi:hypothetical protein